MTPTLIELWIGITFWCLVFAAAGVWFCKDKPAYLIGTAFGYLAALGLSFYMAQSVRLLVGDLDAGLGDKRIRSSSMIRLLIAGVVIAVACIVPVMNPIGTFLGIFSTKPAAYSNPLIHGITKKLFPYFKDKDYPPEENPEGTETEGETSAVEDGEIKEEAETGEEIPSPCEQAEGSTERGAE